MTPWRGGRPQAIILAGGQGQRFWPLSRVDRPKQLLNIFGGVTLLRSTYERLKFIFGPENIWLVTLERYKNAIPVQLPEVPPDQILLEPFGRNTAPSIALAAHLVEKKIGPTTAAVFPCDHIITGREQFNLAVETCLKALETEDLIVTIGVKPRGFETGFGYIRKGRKLATVNSIPLFRGERFVEKPDRKRAEAFVRSKQYVWNAGMFIFRTPTMLAAFKKHLPKLYKLLSPLPHPPSADQIRALYEKCPSDSIDYAVMEKSKNIAVYPGNFVWSDVGSWSALERFFEKDASGIAAKGRVVQIQSKDCFVFNTTRLVALVGVENLHVVETDDAILICRRDLDQNIKPVVHALNDKGWKEFV
ncbi:MAG: mannose-1-phosphate guanylyltransferase [Nitrospirae bacterium]|nr:mannose-1-phosphate guanylyltransferase [Nitrospirota bacterium]